MFYFLQISANDDCPGNRTRYSESHETKTSSHIDNKKKLEDLSSLRINWLKSKFTISSCSLLSNRFSLIVGAGVHVRSKWREEIKRLVLLIKMSQIQQRTSPNSPRHYYGKMDNPLSTTILPWVAVLRDKFCRKSEDMEELSGPCTAPSKSRIPALSTSYLPQMKLSPSFQRSFLWTGKEVFFFKQKKKNEEKSLLFSALYITSLLLSNSPGNSPRQGFKETFPRHVTDWMFARIFNSSPGSLGAVPVARRNHHTGLWHLWKCMGKRPGKVVKWAKNAKALETKSHRTFTTIHKSLVVDEGVAIVERTQ